LHGSVLANRITKQLDIDLAGKRNYANEEIEFRDSNAPTSFDMVYETISEFSQRVDQETIIEATNNLLKYVDGITDEKYLDDMFKAIVDPRDYHFTADLVEHMIPIIEKVREIALKTGVRIIPDRLEEHVETVVNSIEPEPEELSEISENLVTYLDNSYRPNDPRNQIEVAQMNLPVVEVDRSEDMTHLELQESSISNGADRGTLRKHIGYSMRDVATRLMGWTGLSYIAADVFNRFGPTELTELTTGSPETQLTYAAAFGAGLTAGSTKRNFLPSVVYLAAISPEAIDLGGQIANSGMVEDPKMVVPFAVKTAIATGMYVFGRALKERQ
jgi:hypothetical protein